MADFVADLGANAPDETQENEDTAGSQWWYYEGVDDPSSDTPLTGYYLNRGPKAVMSSLKAFASQMETFINDDLSDFINDMLQNAEFDEIHVAKLTDDDVSVSVSKLVEYDDYAQSSKGGTVKMRVDGDTVYITNDGSNA